MARIRITRHTVAANRIAMQGEVLDLPEPEASLLIRLGKAVALAPGAPGLAVEPTRPTPLAWAQETAALTAEDASGIIRRAGRRPRGPRGTDGQL